MDYSRTGKTDHKTTLKGKADEYKSHTNATITNYNMPYRLFNPDEYDSTLNYPMVLFLHGAGKRGKDNNASISSSRGATLWAEAQNQETFPCFVIAPQCPANKKWVNTNWSSGSYNINNVAVSKELLIYSYFAALTNLTRTPCK